MESRKCIEHNTMHNKIRIRLVPSDPGRDFELVHYGLSLDRINMMGGTFFIQPKKHK